MSAKTAVEMEGSEQQEGEVTLPQLDLALSKVRKEAGVGESGGSARG